LLDGSANAAGDRRIAEEVLMRSQSKSVFLTLIALALFSLTTAGCVLGDEGDDPEVDEAGELDEEFVTVPRHAVVVCQDATFYRNYDSSSGPVGVIRTLYYGDKVGHTPGAHPVHNGWAATFKFGASQWGFMRIECIGGYDSW
jgi:hypothetical protein